MIKSFDNGPFIKSLENLRKPVNQKEVNTLAIALIVVSAIGFACLLHIANLEKQLVEYQKLANSGKASTAGAAS